jgi:N-acetylated-alpha-linked acidic dipeptidase
MEDVANQGRVTLVSVIRPDQDPSVLALLVVAVMTQTPVTPPTPIRGFPRDLLAAQAQREDALRAVPSRDSLRARMRLLSAFPHEAGTERSRRVAELVVARFKAAGLDARIEVFEALMPRPVSRVVQLVAPGQATASLRETEVTGDPTSGQLDQLPTYNAYSPDGDVTGDLVYVNYGIPDDYKVLDSLGIDVKGKIVIARYGRSWRGIKPKLAAERGAIGCLIYSDPRDDGFFVDDVYPAGPMRPPQGVQRGSVMDMPTYPGDPLSPGWGSVPGGRKLTLAEAQTIAKIPVLPISYGDAEPLLRQLRGPVPPEGWRGSLPLTYHVGPGPARVRIALKFEWVSRPLYDVVARVPGATFPDQWVIYGNHHDAWVNGANDPISGLVTVEEAARAVGALLKTGWRPARTLVFAAWDGEEWGLLGSTEWAEHHAAELRGKTVAYLNSDTNDRGWVGASGSHSLQTFVEELARDVKDPETGKSALAVALERRRRAQAGDTTFTIGALGSGSDYTAFLDYLNVPTLDIRHGGATHDGIYHSVYDSYTFYERFLDTSFAYGAAQAQLMATAMVRLGDAPVLPFEFGSAARTYRRYLDELDRLLKTQGDSGKVDLAGPRAAVGRVDSAAARYESALRGLDGKSAKDLERRRAALAQVNEQLAHTEQTLGDSAGLPRRPWFRHLMYAPGFYTGYGVKTMPGIREQIEQHALAEAQRETARVTAALDRYAAAIAAAAVNLERALR